MRVSEPFTLLPEQARVLEWLGDDGRADTGFLRSTPGAHHYQLVVDASRFAQRGEYYFAFRRFAQVFLSQPTTRTSPAADGLRTFLQTQRMTGVERGHAPESIPKGLPQKPLPSLKVMTINVEWFLTHWANAKKPEDRLQPLADWINTQDADVIVMSEMLNDWFVKLLPLVPKMQGNPFAHRSSHPNSEVAILSRHRIVEAVMYPQSWASSLPKYCYIGAALNTYRGFGVAQIDYHGTQVAIATLHSTVVDQAENKAQSPHLSASTPRLVNADDVWAERVMTYLDLWRAIEPYLAAHPVIVAGDFNVNPVHRELALWQQMSGMTNALLESQNMGITDYTMPNAGMLCARPDAFETFSACNRRVAHAGESSLGLLDYIFGNGYVHNLYTYIEKSTDGFSDHWAVAGRYQIVPGTGRFTLSRVNYPKSPPPIPEAEISRLITYFSTVGVSWFCAVSDRAQILAQRTNTLSMLRYLQSLY